MKMMMERSKNARNEMDVVCKEIPLREKKRKVDVERMEARRK